MSEIDFDKVDLVDESEEGFEDVEEKNGKKRTTKQQLKVRRAIEDHLDNKRFRKEIDYLEDSLSG